MHHPIARLALAVVAGALAALPLPAEAGPVPAQPAASAFPLGGLRLYALRDARNEVANDGRTFGVGAGPAAVSAVLSTAGRPTDTIDLAVDALLVVEPGHVILIDTGLGPKAHGVFLASLKAAGYSPADVTDVLITHSHGDHVGGLLGPDGALAFPKAFIRMSAKEWAWMQTEGRSDMVRKIAPAIRTFEPGAPILPGVTPIALGGHTPGHVGYEILSDGARLFDIGDTAHSSVISLARPDWVNGYDNDAVEGKASRRATLDMLSKSHELVFAPHFPFPGIGRIEAAGTGYAWKPAAK